MIIKTAREFGLTPAARSSVKVDKNKQLSLLADANAVESENIYQTNGYVSS